MCISSGQVRDGESILGVPVLGNLQSAGQIAARVEAGCVAVSGSDAVTAEVVRHLSWELEPAGVDLMLTTELVDVAARASPSPRRSRCRSCTSTHPGSPAPSSWSSRSRTGWARRSSRSCCCQS
ncbi:hypothetical protein NKG05_18880 [Oerskovia sp. M15]